MVVCANVLGSCYGSTGPQSTDPLTGKQYGNTFPQVHDNLHLKNEFSVVLLVMLPY